MSDTDDPTGPGSTPPPPPPPPPPPSEPPGGGYQPPGGGYRPPPPSAAPPPPPPPPPPQYGQPGQPQFATPQYGQYGTPQPVTGTLPNYMAHAIIATVLGLICCSGIGAVPGIVGIVFASQVKSKEQMGDYAGAQQASKNAKTWSWVGIILGIIAAVLVVGFIILGVALGDTSTTGDFNSDF